MAISLFLYALVVLALLVAELREDRRAQYFFKPLAALGFILLAIYIGALETQYGKIILAGLVACAVGDILLLSRQSELKFKGGMLAFAIGHICYVVAFWKIILPHSPNYMGWAGLIITFIMAGYSIYLFKNVPKKMRGPVSNYCVIIFIMVLLSLGAPLNFPFLFVPIGAIMFAVSDMFVARDRFIKPSPKNALVITPLYFGAQALFALSTTI